jgi:hypothetical protein
MLRELSKIGTVFVLDPLKKIASNTLWGYESFKK